MRSFLIACFILLSVVILITVDSVMVLRRTEDLLALVRSTESSSPAALDDLIAAWQGCRNLISLSVHHSEVERAEHALTVAACSRSDPEAVRIQLRLFAEVMRHIADGHRLMLHNIL